MMLIDANLLLYVKIRSFPEHQAARRWFDATINSGERIGIPWESIVAFIRVSTNARIFEQPLPIDAAWEQVSNWLTLPNVWIPVATDEHVKILNALVPFCKGSSGLIHDAHLAALAISHGLTVFSADGDFARFSGVRWKNPLT